MILYRFSRKHFVQCDMKNVFASYSKFVSESARQMFSSILGWGKLLISKFLMMYICTMYLSTSNKPKYRFKLAKFTQRDILRFLWRSPIIKEMVKDRGLANYLL